jgi:hypothetical protein
MTPRARVLTFGSAAALVVAGALCGVLVSGVVGDVLAIGLVSVGLGGVLLLLFFEVGLSEDRERAREDERRRERAARRVHPGRRPRFQRPRRPG